MPTCKKCGIKFPNRIKIDNRIKVIGNRKYCLDCSPYNKHNTRRLEILTDYHPDYHRVCKTCGRVYIYARKSGHTLDVCNSCIVNGRKEKRKQRCVSYKGSKCATCGYDKCIQALDFHHLNSSEKKFGISGSHCRKWEVLKKELDKCVLLCNRCHVEIHAGIIQLPT